MNLGVETVESKVEKITEALNELLYFTSGRAPGAFGNPFRLRNVKDPIGLVIVDRVNPIVIEAVDYGLCSRLLVQVEDLG